MEITCNYLKYKLLASTKANNTKESTSLIEESATYSVKYMENCT